MKNSYTFEVSVWGYRAEEGKFGYTSFWIGTSFLKAIFIMIRTKSMPFKYNRVSLEWYSEPTIKPTEPLHKRGEPNEI